MNRGGRGGGRNRTQRAMGTGQMPGGEAERMRASGAREKDLEESGRGILRGARDVMGTVGGATAGGARQLASGAKNAASGVARGTRATVDKVRENPWPSLLIGAGVTWLAVDAIRGRSSDDENRRGRRQRQASGPGVMKRTASTIAGAGRGAGEYVGDFVRERPLLAGAATLGIGMAVGMAMPSTSAEDSLMGNVRDTVVRRTKDAARSTMDAVRDAADSVERIAGGGGRERMR